MCGSTVDIQSPTAEIRRGKKEERRRKTEITWKKYNVSICYAGWPQTVFSHILTLKYHLVTVEPPFTVKTINWMHLTWPRILLSVTHMLYINQVCHGVGRCVKDGSCFLSSLSESQWTVLMEYLTISTKVGAIKSNTWQMTIFLSRRQCTGALSLQHSLTAVAVLTNITFESKMRFLCFHVMPGSAEAQVIWGGILKHLLIAYSLSNISAKKYQNLFMCVKVIASHRWDGFFETRCRVPYCNAAKMRKTLKLLVWCPKLTKRS